MSTAAVRTALVDLVSGIAGIGTVHDRERYAARESDLATLYKQPDDTLLGWHVRRLAVLGRESLPSGRVLATTRWIVRGFSSFRDGASSEIAFDALLDAIVAAEAADPTLGGTVRGLPVEGRSGMQIAESGPVMFAGVLCHGARLTLDVQTIEPSTGGSLAAVPGAAGRLVGAVVDRLAATTTGFGTIEGRIDWHPDDDPAVLPAAVVVPRELVATPAPETTDFRQRVRRRIGVIVTAPAGHAAGAGALAAGGLEALCEQVRDALQGWGESAGLDFPLAYAVGAPTSAAIGRTAFLDIFEGSDFWRT